MARVYKFIVVCMVSCVVLIGILYALMPLPNKKKNGFNRMMTKRQAVLERVVDIKYTGYYLAGNTEKKIYLGNYDAPLHFFSLGIIYNDTLSQNLEVEKNDSGYWKYSRLSVDSPLIFMTEGMSPNIYVTDVVEKKLRKEPWNLGYFTNSINISPSSFIAKGTAGNSQSVLFKIKLDTPGVVINSNILNKQVDGIFCVDGSFVKSSDRGKLLYMYFYRNEILCLDTNLTILNKIKTIDTNSVAKIQISNIDNRGTTFSAPATRVNYYSASYDDDLYVSSALLSDNQSLSDIKRNEIIDIYSMIDGAYKKSFLLPKYQGKRSLQFLVTGKKLISLNSHFILIYNLP